MSYLISFASFVYEFLFGCNHTNVTRPFTLRNESRMETYKVCLDCGHHLPYSAVNMSYVRPRILHAAKRPVVSVVPQPALRPISGTRVLAFQPVRREAVLQDSNAAA